MIELRPGRWAYADEFALPLQGREDPPEMVAACVDYLQHRFGERGATQSRHRPGDVVVRSALAAARVQASTIAASGVTARRLAELAATLVQQQATIDRLLALIPGRVRELAPEELAQVRRRVVAWARELFGLHQDPAVDLEAERDPGTEHCHRIVVKVPEGALRDPEEHVQREFELQRRLATELAGDAYRAIQLSVEIDPAA